MIVKKLFLSLFLLGLAALYGQAPDWVWAQWGGGNSTDMGFDIAVDAAGNSYVTGNFGKGMSDPADFGSTHLVNGGWGDIFIAKMDPAGNWLWAVGAGGAGEEAGYGIAVDGLGNCYVTGTFFGTGTFGPFTLVNANDRNIFVAKLDTNGNWLWAVQAGGVAHDYGYAIALDGSGSSFITGRIGYSASFGSINLNTGEDDDIFVAKLDPLGN